MCLLIWTVFSGERCGLLFFFVSTTSLNPLYRILWKFVVMKNNILFRFAYSQDSIFSWNYAPFEYRNLLWNSLLAQLLQKPLYTTSCNFIVKVDILCTCAYSQEILIWFFFSGEHLNRQTYIILCKLC